MHFLCEKDSISKRGECIYQNKGNCIPPFSDRHYLSRPMCVSGKYFSCGIQNLGKYVACGILACVASVSVRFRSKEWGTRVKDRAKLAQVKERGGVGKKGRKLSFLSLNLPSLPPPPPRLFYFLVLVSFIARAKPKIPFHGLFLLRNQTETLATQASQASGILGFRIQNTAQGIRNRTNDRNPESNLHWQRLESSTWNPQSTAWGPESIRLSWIPSTWGDLSILTFHLPLQDSKSMAGILCTLSLAVVPRWFFWFPDKFSRLANCYYCCCWVKMLLSGCGDARRWCGLNWALREKEIKLNVEFLNYPYDFGG